MIGISMMHGIDICIAYYTYYMWNGYDMFVLKIIKYDTYILKIYNNY